jgi:hypothetical protein
MGLAHSEWRLAIRGKNNQFTNWTDFFSTSESAIKTGLAAIKKEGLTQFYSSPDCKAFL